MNGWLGQASLKGVERPSLGWHSPTARGIYKPAPIKLPLKRSALFGLSHSEPASKRMGDDSSIFSPSIGTAFLMTVGGLAGLYFSPALPTPADSVMKGLGIGLAGWGGYNLFTKFFGGPSGPELDNKAKAEATPIVMMSPEAFAKVSGQIILPLPDTIPQVQSDWFTPEYFEIKTLWRNDSKEVGNFKYNILAESVSAPGMWIPGQTSIQKIINDSQVSGLLPGAETGSTPIKVELFQPPQPGSIAKAYGAKSTYKIYLQLQKIGPSGTVPAGNTMTFGPFDYK